jgi:hypothetical protein
MFAFFGSVNSLLRVRYGYAAADSFTARKWLSNSACKAFASGVAATIPLQHIDKALRVGLNCDRRRPPNVA